MTMGGPSRQKVNAQAKPQEWKYVRGTADNSLSKCEEE